MVDLARGCMIRVLNRGAVGEIDTRNAQDIETAEKLEFRHAFTWLDDVLGPLRGELVSLSPAPNSKSEARRGRATNIKLPIVA